MDVWSDRHRRWLVVVITVTALFVTTGIAAYADSGYVRGMAGVVELREPVATPTVVSGDAGDMVEPAILDDITIQPTIAIPATPAAPVRVANTAKEVAPQAASLIANGGFEDGFSEGIGLGWGRFATGGVQAGWQDDTWDAVLYEGAHAQLLVLKDASEQDRYVGIFQTVTVAPDTDYVLTLRGLLRSDEGSIAFSNYGYRLQYGIDYAGGTDWQSPEVQWAELPWDEQPRTAPPAGGYRMDSYAATVRSQGPKMTLFIRGWKKWVGAAEGNFDIDGISLVLASALPAASTVVPPPVAETPVVVTPPPTVAGAQPTAAPQMPQTGGRTPIVDNGGLVVASVLLVVVLLAGVIWQMSRRRA
jgi:hypothetical protein